MLSSDPKCAQGGQLPPLYRIMACMRDIRKRAERTEASFTPLRDTVALLVRYNISTSEATLKQLEDAPLGWRALQKKMQARCCTAVLLGELGDPIRSVCSNRLHALAQEGGAGPAGAGGGNRGAAAQRRLPGARGGLPRLLPEGRALQRPRRGAQAGACALLPSVCAACQLSSLTY
jgi:hypothetical protein